MRQTQKLIGSMYVPWACYCSDIRGKGKVKDAEEEQSDNRDNSGQHYAEIQVKSFPET